MKEKNLIDLYRKQLAESAEKAPEGLWEEIAHAMDADSEQMLIQQYQEQVAHSSEKAPEGLWDSMARKMDIDEVWEGIAAGLVEERRKGFIWFDRRIAAAIAFLLISSLSVWFISNLFFPRVEIADTETEIIKIDELIDSQEPAPDTPGQATSPEFTIAIIESNDDTIKPELNTTALVILEDQQGELFDDRMAGEIFHENLYEEQIISIDPIEFRGGILIEGGLPSLAEYVPGHSNAAIASDYNFDRMVSNDSPGIFALGITTSMKNTWLFNNETFQGFNPSSGTTTHLQIYPDIAVNLRYRASDRWELESSLSFSSNTGQNYEQYIYGRYSQRSISLNYFHGEVLTNYQHRYRWVIRSQAISHSTAFGLYYARLNTATETIAGVKQDISDLYLNNDYGLIVGHNLNIPIAGRLMFSPGLHITWGLPNIYQGEYVLPSLKRTHNRSIEFRLSLYYLITK